jgi:hypothetical protein
VVTDIAAVGKARLHRIARRNVSLVVGPGAGRQLVGNQLAVAVDAVGHIPRIAVRADRQPEGAGRCTRQRRDYRFAWPERDGRFFIRIGLDAADALCPGDEFAQHDLDAVHGLQIAG